MAPSYPGGASRWFGSAGWSFAAGARCRRTVPRRVTLVSVSCVRAWDPNLLALGVLAGSPEHEVYDGLVEPVASGGQVPEGFDGELGPVLL